MIIQKFFSHTTTIFLLALSCACLNFSSATPQAHAAPAKKKVAAKKKAPAKKVVPLKAKRGYIVGRVTNAAGKPLSGAEVNIYGTTMAGANTSFSMRSNAQGLFSQRLPEGIYGASAYYQTTFNGKNYRFTLMPTDGITAKQHDSSGGIVKQFVWKISGLKPGERKGEEGAFTETTKYYGGYIYLTSKEEGFGGDKVYFPAGSTLIIALTPRGKLIDGSTGSTRTFQRKFPQDMKHSVAWHLVNIPVGLYKLSAKVNLPGGATKLLNVQNRNTSKIDDPFTSSINLDFEPTTYGDLQLMQVMVEP